MKINLNMYFNKTCKKLNIILKFSIQSKEVHQERLKQKQQLKNYKINFLFSKKYDLVTKINHIINNKLFNLYAFTDKWF